MEYVSILINNVFILTNLRPKVPESGHDGSLNKQRGYIPMNDSYHWDIPSKRRLKSLMLSCIPFRISFVRLP